MYKEKGWIKMSDGIKVDLKIRNIPKGYILLQTEEKRFMMSLPKHIHSIIEVHTISESGTLMSALCHLKDGGKMIRWIQIPKVT